MISLYHTYTYLSSIKTYMSPITMCYNEDMVRDKNLIDYNIRHQDRSDFFHSSGYAVAQNGKGIGAAGAGNTDSFATRQAMEQNRQHIRNYRDSQIGNARWSGCEAKRYDKSTDLNRIQNRKENDLNTSGVDSLSNRRVGGGYGRSNTLDRPQPTLSNAKAPIVPSRRSGI